MDDQPKPTEIDAREKWATRFAARYWSECRFLSAEGCMARARYQYTTMSAMDPFLAADLFLQERKNMGREFSTTP